jgi:hypothetical protein
VIVAEVILLILLAYLSCGLAVGVPFILRGVDRVDEAARGSSLGFRLLILPGTVALWPLMALKWIRAELFVQSEPRTQLAQRAE